MKKLFISIVLCLLLGYFHTQAQERPTELPEKVALSQYKQTDFVPTLASAFTANENIVYCATMPYAWEALRKFLNVPITNITNKQLAILNADTTHLDAFEENQCDVKVEVEKHMITTKASFETELPFSEPFTKFDTPLQFKNASVASFGFHGASTFASINYYHNETDFSITLYSHHYLHNIVLVMAPEFSLETLNLKAYWDRIQAERDVSIIFSEEDVVQIPMICFNIEKEYEDMKGSTFKAADTLYTLRKVTQRNAFLLNEKGAKASGDVLIMAADGIPSETSKPKKMIFNQPFAVFLQKRDGLYPYFGMYIANGELLIQKHK
ncbi:hypothetical protein SAMN05216480_10434 [Pustulibacterium marinum]|uniref:Serpin (Serine protease inhibitor) n=1 Tax=Pustulibacterium marinum TaxID=1224947 RepID=A0A1I7GAI2_9FLAO|nr:hypothetical protein [Pustulibacterium marinum]SFU45460.1 hypothetical protein SAMN05216480_10434 [Pustulibacterium marinum]